MTDNTMATRMTDNTMAKKGQTTGNGLQNTTQKNK
jgi:hypothetical protein